MSAKDYQTMMMGRINIFTLSLLTYKMTPRSCKLSYEFGQRQYLLEPKVNFDFIQAQLSIKTKEPLQNQIEILMTQSLRAKEINSYFSLVIKMIIQIYHVYQSIVDQIIVDEEDCDDDKMDVLNVNLHVKMNVKFLFKDLLLINWSNSHMQINFG
ncbi:unnamed protein product [Paramecium primaurelia]|uniref:Uncharacterized protein n=1 Tax=Paramecium primaurelia TaxID=5886 RepID=A0A8S1QHP3_PARPR|nr:unnamed protein product [Paramecium primaurelia]